MIFEAKSIAKQFDSKTVLEDASMYIDCGEYVCILGDSGCGKSTFARIVCGMLPADSGSFTKLGLSVQMVYQQPWSALDPHQRIGKGFREIIRYHHFAEGKEETDKLIGDKLACVGLDEEILGHLPGQVSGGEAQRICIARALLFSPDLLILDESTSMLDVKTQQEIVELVKDIICGRGGAVLHITHDKELAACVSDRIYDLKDGKMRERLCK